MANWLFDELIPHVVKKVDDVDLSPEALAANRFSRYVLNRTLARAPETISVAFIGNGLKNVPDRAVIDFYRANVKKRGRLGYIKKKASNDTMKAIADNAGVPVYIARLFMEHGNPQQIEALSTAITYGGVEK